MSLRMRAPEPEPELEPELELEPPPKQEQRPEPGAARRYSGPLAVPEGSGQVGVDPASRAGAETPPGSSGEPGEPGGSREADPGEPSAAPGPAGRVTPTVPPPSSVRDVPEHIAVAVGLGPRAPGTREERSLLDALAANVDASSDPTTEVRRLRPGREARRICREQRDALVIMIDYVADRPSPVVLAYDCGLGEPLGMRALAAASTTGLVAELWHEHHERVREGARPRRRMPLGPRARAGIIAGAAIAVVGVAVGALVANALRDETVVITVRP